MLIMHQPCNQSPIDNPFTASPISSVHIIVASGIHNLKCYSQCLRDVSGARDLAPSDIKKYTHLSLPLELSTPVQSVHSRLGQYKAEVKFVSSFHIDTADLCWIVVYSFPPLHKTCNIESYTSCDRGIKSNGRIQYHQYTVYIYVYIYMWNETIKAFFSHFTTQLLVLNLQTASRPTFPQ